MPQFRAACDLVLNLPDGGPDYVTAGTIREYDEAPSRHWVSLDDPQPVKAQKAKPKKIGFAAGNEGAG